jgi:hypothetical protein
LVCALGGGSAIEVGNQSEAAEYGNPWLAISRIEEVCCSPAAWLPAMTIAICLLWGLWRWLLN